jgi:hypothetical protein
VRQIVWDDPPSRITFHTSQTAGSTLRRKAWLDPWMVFGRLGQPTSANWPR